MTKKLITLTTTILLILTLATPIWSNTITNGPPVITDTPPLPMFHPDTGEPGVWFPDHAVLEIRSALAYMIEIEHAYGELSDAYGTLHTFVIDEVVPAYEAAADSAALHRRQRNYAIGGGVVVSLIAFLTGLVL